MASKSDGSTERVKKRVSRRRMKQPPLLKQLKGILSEYPDGGQILKELIQNAEDAGAHEVRFMYDRRRINDGTECSKDKPYTRFFKGPALCVYNDAMFTENDWEGIQMIYSSVKEDDPLKVGRFGLGFKSVFHMTDFPCVLSGDRMLLIDPQQDEISPDYVNSMFELNNLEDYADEGFSSEAFWRVLGGTFGLEKDTFAGGRFHGTLFYFPLRQQASALSETLYDEGKVIDLFEALHEEASNILIFLKSVEMISLHIRDENQPIRERMMVRIEENDGHAVRESRREFNRKVSSVERGYIGEDLHSVMNMRISASSGDVRKCTEWLVVNYFVGSSASDSFRKLAADVNLGYSPYVGVAAPIGREEESEEFEGNVFCFLPLPREGERLTGLPVHVNGFFALSQNRHHMKWETDEQHGKKIGDKSILWNKALITEALPRAYEVLIEEAIKRSTGQGNSAEDIKYVYNMLPKEENGKERKKYHSRWQILKEELYRRLGGKKLLYCENIREWITANEAFFAVLNSFSSATELQKDEVKKVVVKCLQIIGKKYVDIPFHLFVTLQNYFSHIRDLDPRDFANYLRCQGGYHKLEDTEKKTLLHCLLHSTQDVNILKDLELLPLASGKWTIFCAGRSDVFLCSDEVIRMFPGQEQKLIMKSCGLGGGLAEWIEKICKSGKFQIKQLDQFSAKTLLKETMKTNFGSYTQVRLSRSTSLKVDWLETVWDILTRKQIVQHFRDLPLIPVLENGTWNNPEMIRLCCLADFLLLREFGGMRISEEICCCFSAMSVAVIPNLPHWIPEDVIREYIYLPTSTDILSLLLKLSNTNRDKVANDFNSKCTMEMAEALVAYVRDLNFDKNTSELLKSLRIFKSVRSVTGAPILTSINQTPLYVMESINFPDSIAFGREFVKITDLEEHLVKKLGGQKQTPEMLSEHFLQNLSYRQVVEMQQFFEYFLKNFRDFELNRQVCQLARNVAFIRVGSSWRKPGDLFDPSDTILNDLLFSEGVFPEQNYILHVPALKLLGLKRQKDIDCNTMLSVANTLHRWSSCDASRRDIVRKASAFKNILQSRPDILRSRCSSGLTLHDSIQNLSCIFIKQERPSDFPDILPWYSEGKLLCTPTSCKVTKFQYIVGSTIPVVDWTDAVARYFTWDTSPNITEVIQQIEICQHQFEQNPTNNYAFCAYIQKLYNHLSTRLGEVKSQTAVLQEKKVVWTGQLFEKPSKVLANASRQELDLKPYIYKIPGEFAAFISLFVTMKCPERLTSALLLRVLSEIKDKTNSCDVPLTKSQDTNVLLEVLKNLSALKQSGDNGVTDNTLILIDDGSECIKLKPAAFCILADDEDEIDSEEMASVFTVHRLVPEEVAVILGVRSVEKKTIHDASEDIDFKEWGQSEALTTRIHSLLAEGYQDGLSVPKELIQNADDAGATVVKFLYDERRNIDHRKKLLSSRLSECQGPALWVYNDSVFTEGDMENIVKLNGGTKAECEDKIGKFGLGFCSVYNLTDVPSFLSRKDFVVFDPHETYLEEARKKKGTGLRINLAKRNLIRRNIDQFKPFASVFGCSVTEPDFTGYEGTLFRLPLRTDEQAQKSLISQEAYSKSKVIELLKKFSENVGNILLFTQNVKTVQVFHLPAGEEDPKNAEILFEVHKEVNRVSASTLQLMGKDTKVENVLARMPSLMKTDKHFQELHLVDLSLKFTGSSFLKFDVKEQHRTVTWIVSWAAGKTDSIRLARQKVSCRAVPLTSVAVQVQEGRPVNMAKAGNGFYTKGHLFCFLPLPIVTSLEIHINGCFHVTSDRRNLIKLTEDDIRKSEGDTWNAALMQDSLVHSFLQLLAYLSAQNSPQYRYYELWPFKVDANTRIFKQSFVHALFTEKTRLFKGNENWLSVEEIIFIDPCVRERNIGDLAFELLSKVPFSHKKQVVEMPRNVLDMLRLCKSEKAALLTSAMISEEDLVIFFLDSIDNKLWHGRDQERNRFVLYALNCNSKQILAKLKTTKCIPSEPKGILCRPDEMIDPDAEIAKLFDTNEGVFPLASSEFSEKAIVLKLVELGLRKDSVSHSVLRERCHTVKILCNTCNTCALERSLNVLKYISSWEHMTALERDKEALHQIQNIDFVPIMSCPESWKFTWGANDVVRKSDSIYCSTHISKKGEKEAMFASPRSVYRESKYMCVGSVCSFVDELSVRKKCYPPDKLYQVLAVKSDVTVDIIVKQLVMLSEQYLNVEVQFSNAEKISRSAFENLGRLVQKQTKEEINKIQCLKTLETSSVILIGKALVPPASCAFEVYSECPPDIYKLRDSDFSKKHVYLAMGVSEHFSLRYMIDLFQKLKNDDTQPDVQYMTGLISNLCDCMSREGKSYADLKNFWDTIVAPDTSRVLRPTYELVIEDPAFETHSDLHILHELVSPAMGKQIGVTSKQRKIVERFSSKILMPFGQHESLVTRLNGILEDYPCDSSIMKELIQNADDAGATEIHIIKNYDSYPPSKLFANELQGPSVCIFNDSFFTKEDFEGIRNLGIGSKREDTSKTGQYGIGFNAVYHLSDIPSFLTKGPNLGDKGQLCIFDPLLSFLEDGVVSEENPGIRCDAREVEKIFPEILLGYPEIDRVDQGTVFRLPLRQKQSLISKNIMTVKQMDKLIEDFKCDMFGCMVFLKSLKRIKVLKIDQGKLEEEYSVSIELSEKDNTAREEYFQKVKMVVQDNKDCRHLNLEVDPLESSYVIKISDSNKLTEIWRITNRFGAECKSQPNPTVVKALRQKGLGLLPWASVAMKLHYETAESSLRTAAKGHRPMFPTDGKAYCFLPLPIKTGLPLHVNGHFALDKARSKLIDEGIRKEWNDFLISDVISQCWISTILFLQSNLFECSANKEKYLQSGSELVLLDVYHSYFPLMSNASDDYWKRLVSAFYKTVIRHEEKVFPCIYKSGKKVSDSSGGNVSKIEWVSLSLSEENFKGFFNVIYKTLSTLKTASVLPAGCARSLETSLKNLGMKIIETPKEIRKSLEESGVKNVPVCDPKSVFMFLRTYEGIDENTCNLGAVGSFLSETNMRDIGSLINLLMFLKADQKFPEQLKGSPLCLTADMKLCVFTNAMYWSEMSDILTASREKFLHPLLLTLLGEQKLFEINVLRKFNIEDLLHELPKTFNPDTFASARTLAWNKETGIPCQPSTIQRIFHYIYQESIGQSGYVEHEMFQANVQKLMEWSFLPAVTRYGNEPFCQLMPLSHASRLLVKGSGNHQVNVVLNKFNIPTLDILVFCDKKYNLVYQLQNMLPSTEKPSLLLNCLAFYTSRIASATLQQNDGRTILEYFNGSLEQMKKTMPTADLKSKLKALPLYLTQQKELIAIAQKTHVLVLPSGMPSDGITHWGEATGIVLLAETFILDNLYTFLDVTRSSAGKVYSDYILPQIQHLPRENWFVHVVYIREHLLMTSYRRELNQEQRMLVARLRKLAFIHVSGRDMRVDELYDPTDKVFKNMLDESCFIPSEYRTPEWENFLELLGLIKEPSDEMMIEFASEIARNVHSPISNRIRQQSEALVECLFSRKWDFKTLQEIKELRFVIPCQVDSIRRDVFHQPGDGAVLIALSGAISVEFEDFCWSTINLLKDVPGEEMMKSLGIFDRPPIDKVVQHCQNICDVFKRKLDDEAIQVSFIKILMEKLYRMLENNFSSDMKQKFQVTPLVFIPHSEIMVDLQKIVLSASEKEVIEPFLFKLPTCFGPFEKLFENLGVMKSPESSHYAMVLESVRNKYRDEQLPKSDLLVVKKALENLTFFLEKEENPLKNVKKLFLPDKDHKLVDSSLLVVSNNADIEERLHGNCDLHLFVGFRELEIVSVRDPALPFYRMPSKLRPQILTDVVIEEIDTDNIEKGNDVYAQLIESFIQSPELTEGILRLVKHQMRVDSKPFENIIEVRIINALSNVKLTKVTGLKTYLTHNGNRVEGTERDAVCFIKIEETNNGDVAVSPDLYFQCDSSEELLDLLIGEPEGLVKLIEICTMDILGKDMIKHVMTILHYMKNPAEIRKKLNKLKIDAYDLPQTFARSVFPKPGTYVEEQFFPFLQHALVRFKIHEFSYVALEIEEESENNEGTTSHSEDDQQLIYVYAHILREVKGQRDVADVLVFYEVDVGQRSDGPIVVPIHRLYKFIPTAQTEVSALELYDIEPIGCIQIDENFRRVRQTLVEAWSAKMDERGWKRVIRRLKTRWHPDRNREHQDYASRVFNYIDEIVLRLERGEVIDEHISEQTGRFPPDMSGSSYSGVSSAALRRGKRYAAAFYSNLEQYNRANKTGPYAHHRAEEAVVRHFGEARRWLKQAQQDFIAASTNTTTAESDQSFNWVCYKCHQAAEKALKAAWFSKNANRATTKQHSLTSLAVDLDDGTFRKKAEELEVVIENYFSLRYPDAFSDRHTIPSEKFTKAEADESLVITKDILRMASDFIG